VAAAAEAIAVVPAAMAAAAVVAATEAVATRPSLQSCNLLYLIPSKLGTFHYNFFVVIFLSIVF
jgi:hypothetical protein